MKLQILLHLILQVALVESLWEVFGYLGDNITLHSGADSSWELTTIEWSIFSNNTWIATYRTMKKNIERVDRYKRRLSLNTSTGDLMIYNLTKEDAIEYTVDLTNNEDQDIRNKITVTVRHHLQKPNMVIFESRNESCNWFLQCSSKDEDVALSWQGVPPSGIGNNLANPDANSKFISAFVNATKNNVEIACTSHRDTENASNVIALKCGGKKPKPQPLPDPKYQLHRCIRARYGTVLLVGVILGSVLTVIACIFYRKLLF